MKKENTNSLTDSEQKSQIETPKVNFHSRIKDLLEEDRPREKLLKKGVAQLTDRELLAILLRTGLKNKSVLTVAEELLKNHHSLARLAQLSIDDLVKQSGIGADKAATLQACFEIGRRIKADDRLLMKKSMTDPKMLAEFFSGRLRDEIVEKLYIVALNTANKVIAYSDLTSGSLDASIVDVAQVYKYALAKSAKSIVLVHNHPSGNPKPSNADIEVTKKVKHAGQLLGVQLLDHIIIAGDNYTSLAALGYV